VLVFVVGAFAEMSEDVSRICCTIAHDLARTHVSYYNDDAKRIKGITHPPGCAQRKAVPRKGWIRLLGEVALRVEDAGAERPRIGLTQRLVDGRRQAPRLRWQVDNFALPKPTVLTQRCK